MVKVIIHIGFQEKTKKEEGIGVDKYENGYIHINVWGV